MRDLRIFLLWKEKNYPIPHEMLCKAKKQWKEIGDLIKEEEELHKHLPPKNQMTIFEEVNDE